MTFLSRVFRFQMQAGKHAEDNTSIEKDVPSVGSRIKLEMVH